MYQETSFGKGFSGEKGKSVCFVKNDEEKSSETKSFFFSVACGREKVILSGCSTSSTIGGGGRAGNRFGGYPAGQVS